MKKQDLTLLLSALWSYRLTKTRVLNVPSQQVIGRYEVVRQVREIDVLEQHLYSAIHTEEELLAWNTKNPTNKA